MKTFEQYLKENCEQGKIDFSVRVTLTDGRPVAYIYPTNADGETLDFYPDGNYIVTKQEATAEDHSDLTLEFDDMMNYILEKLTFENAGITREQVETILNLETDYMVEKGIAAMNDEDSK